ncbi:TPA: DotI/IcmL/TraM family protein [Aeromonas veronii]|nr:DotI/IcmL/TraM family protein [Aeromonas veronii]
MFGKGKQAAQGDDLAPVVQNSDEELENQSVRPIDLEVLVVRKTNKLLGWIVCGLLLVDIAASAAVYYRSTMPPVPGDTYAMDLDGNRVKLLAIEGSGSSTTRLLNYTSDVAAMLFTFNFQNRARAIDSYKDNFTALGFQRYKKVIQIARIDVNQDNNMEAWTAIAHGVPVIANEPTVIGDSTMWLMQVEILIQRMPKSSPKFNEVKRVTLELQQKNGGNFKINDIKFDRAE